VTLGKIFGQVLKKIRIDQGLSQEQLAFESGFHRTYISLLERGQKNPSLKTIFQLSKTLKINPSDMLRRIEIQATKLQKDDHKERRHDR